MKQKRDRYEMHKYWGKKPASDLNKLIEKYTNEGDTVLDPFSGYGVFGCEALILNRNVILNDLNPIANFLNNQLLMRDVDLDLIKEQWEQIKSKFEPFVNNWYKWAIDGDWVVLNTILRDNNDFPIKARYYKNGIRKVYEIDFDKSEIEEFLTFESSQLIEDWYPETKLIENSRISAKEGMTVADLFTKRTLSCHAKLLSLIETNSSGSEQNLFKVAFTANLANCSKLVPPIKSRGEMAPGAWMTGFYTGETYLENNVLTYFENRLNKVIKGKEDYLNLLDSSDESYHYKTLQNDAKCLDIEDEEVDYVFTDPPYGGAVPYFEQSIIWNSWLKLNPDYENEIVVSNSKKREKENTNFENDINIAFSEIRRVLKLNKHFSLTYHSLSGLEWKAITNACIKNGFEMVHFKWLVQKSFTPRQINRLKSIKGDVLITFKKLPSYLQPKQKSDEEIIDTFNNLIKNWIAVERLDTNEIFLRVMKIVFKEKYLLGDFDLKKLLTQNFIFSEDTKWSLNE
jgi:DNA modification methylase